MNVSVELSCRFLPVGVLPLLVACSAPATSQPYLSTTGTATGGTNGEAMAPDSLGETGGATAQGEPSVDPPIFVEEEVEEEIDPCIEGAELISPPFPPDEIGLDPIAEMRFAGDEVFFVLDGTGLVRLPKAGGEPVFVTKASAGVLSPFHYQVAGGELYELEDEELLVKSIADGQVLRTIPLPDETDSYLPVPEALKISADGGTLHGVSSRFPNSEEYERPDVAKGLKMTVFWKVEVGSDTLVNLTEPLFLPNSGLSFAVDALDRVWFTGLRDFELEEDSYTPTGGFPVVYRVDPAASGEPVLFRDDGLGYSILGVDDDYLYLSDLGIYSIEPLVVADQWGVSRTPVAGGPGEYLGEIEPLIFGSFFTNDQLVFLSGYEGYTVVDRTTDSVRLFKDSCQYAATDGQHAYYSARLPGEEQLYGIYRRPLPQ